MDVMHSSTYIAATMVDNRQLVVARQVSRYIPEALGRLIMLPSVLLIKLTVSATKTYIRREPLLTVALRKVM